ncbi:Large ribosomal subunit protein [Trichinella pseudospiralis]
MATERNFINGRPRHPQSQGEIEQLNDRVKEKLAIWMRDNDSDRRFLGLKFNHASVLAQILRDDDSCADGVESDPSKIASGSSCQEMEFFKSDQNKRSMLIQTIEDQRRWN